MSIKKCPSSGKWCEAGCSEWDPCRMLPNQGIPAERRVQVPDPWPVNPRRDTVYTIMWCYSDNSAYGIVDVAFRRREEAEDLLRILNEHGNKTFAICQSVLKG